MIERAAAGAGLELKAHPHMLRHACGYALANKGHDTSGNPGLAGAPVDHQHRGLHGAGAEQIQGLLAGVIACKEADLRTWMPQFRLSSTLAARRDNDCAAVAVLYA